MNKPMLYEGSDVDGEFYAFIFPLPLFRNPGSSATFPRWIKIHEESITVFSTPPPDDLRRMQSDELGLQKSARCDCGKLEVTYSFHQRSDGADFTTCNLCGVRVENDWVLKGWRGEILRREANGYKDLHTAWHQRVDK